jgi:hypothetical protein
MVTATEPPRNGHAATIRLGGYFGDLISWLCGRHGASVW